MGKTTICIPAYNASNTIGETLNSIINQTFSDLEIIVSDNYSTDNTKEVVKEYEAKGVQTVTCPTLPVKTGSLLDNCTSSSQNWNSLINLGQGEFIGIYHADDIYNSEIVHKQVCFLQEHKECPAVFTMLKYIDTSGKEIQPGWKKFFKDDYLMLDQPSLIDALAVHHHFFSTSGVMLRRDAWRKAGKFDSHFGQALDTEFWIRISGIGPVGILNEPLVNYRISDTQDTAAWKKIYKYDYIPFLQVMNHYIFEKDLQKQLKNESLGHVKALKYSEDIRIALNWINSGNIEKAKEVTREIRGINLKKAGRFILIREHRLILKMLLVKLLFLGKKMNYNSMINFSQNRLIGLDPNYS